MRHTDPLPTGWTREKITRFLELHCELGNIDESLRGIDIPVTSLHREFARLILGFAKRP